MNHDLNPAQESPRDKQYLVEAADLVKNKMPEGYGFIIFAFPLLSTGRMFYIANGERKDCLKALKEWIAQVEARGLGKHV